MAVYNIIQRSTIKEGNNILAEHYQKERMENENLLKKVSSYKIKHYFKESTETINPVLLNSDWRVFDLTDSISQFLIGGINPEEVEVSSNKKIAQPSSFIISRLRHYLKEMAIVPTISEKIALSTEYLVFKSKSDVTPHLLLVFSLTKYVQTILDWAQTGNAHPRFSSITFKNIYLPDILVERSNIYQSVIDESIDLLNKSRETYNQAAELLAKALGLNDIQFKNEKSYTASFSEIVTNNRSDADFYQTKYRQLAIHLDKLNTAYLGSICMFNKGYEVGSALYTEEGPLFIRVSNLSKEGIVEGGSDKYISSVTYNQFKSHQPQVGDILLTKDGTIGTCYVVDEKVEGIISSGILNLTLNDLDIPKEYLALVINSKICRMQATRDCSGALILHWKPEQIRKLRIPILSKSLMNELSDLVIESKKAQKKSKELLEQAIEEVESLIEKAAERL